MVKYCVTTMRISSETIKALLLKSGGISPEDLKQAETISLQTSEPLDQVVVRRHLIGERELVKLYAASIKVAYIDLTSIKIPRTTLAKIPERIAKQYQVVVFGQLKGSWQLAMADPEDIQAIDVIEKQLGSRVLVYVASPGDILTVLDQYRTGLDLEINQAIKDSSPTNTLKQSTVSAEDISEDAPIAKTVNIILEYAVKAHASDVHIEPRENIVQIRYRIDGMLKESMTLPRQILPAVISRIKIMANLKIDEHRLPQDGRFKANIGAKSVAVRVATLPIMDGEKVVMRILDETTRASTLEELGFKGQALTSIKTGMKQPHGMILVTGPTGAGKSTTLYSILTALNTPNVNISTVEDPVEYRVQGVNQTQVNTQSGMTFANGLRALLRQDPNIIMVGEIRDSETANLAVQAALTGHTVLSTLHTNNAATTLPRLLDMQIEPFLISTTVNTVVAQRLVRRLCAKCRQPYTPGGELLKEIKSTFAIDETLRRYRELHGAAPTAPKAVAQLAPAVPKSGVTITPARNLGDVKDLVESNSPHRPASEHQIGEMRKVIPVSEKLDTSNKSILDRIAEDPNIINRPSRELQESAAFQIPSELKVAQIPQAPTAKVIDDEISTLDQEPPVAKANVDSDSIVLYRAVGCRDCDGTGFMGRMGIYEVLDISPEIGKLIMSKATANDIQKQGMQQGMVTMQEDGFEKALEGDTTVEEVLRVTRE